MKKKADNTIRVNKTPYFLLNTYIMEKADIDEDRMILYGVDKESNYTKANPLYILFLKLIPMLIVIPFLTIPNSKVGFAIFAVSVFFLAVFTILYEYASSFFLKIVILSSLLSVMYISIYLPKINIEEYFFAFVHYFSVLLVLYIVLRDLVNNNPKEYYSLGDVSTEKTGVVVHKGERKYGKIPFTKKSLLSFKIRENKHYHLSFKGHFFIMKKEKAKEKEND